MLATLSSLAVPLAVAAALILACAGFMTVRALRFLIDRRRGWWWVALAGAPVVASWLVGDRLQNGMLVPLLATPLYALSLVGLCPDDSVVRRATSADAMWFRRGLWATIAASVAGAVLWVLIP